MASTNQPSHYKYPKFNQSDQEEALRAASRRYRVTPFMTASNVAFLKGLDLIDVESSEVRCCGRTGTGAGCRNQIEKNELVRTLQALLVAAGDRSLVGGELEVRLSNIAIHFLCKRWHQDDEGDEEAWRLGEEWYEVVVRIRADQDTAASFSPSASTAGAADVKKEPASIDDNTQEYRPQYEETFDDLREQIARLTEKVDLLGLDESSLSRQANSGSKYRGYHPSRGKNIDTDRAYLEHEVNDELEDEPQDEEYELDDEEGELDDEKSELYFGVATPTSPASPAPAVNAKPTVSAARYGRIKRQRDEARFAFDEADETLVDVGAENDELKAKLASMEQDNAAGRKGQVGRSTNQFSSGLASIFTGAAPAPVLHAAKSNAREHRPYGFAARKRWD